MKEKTARLILAVFVVVTAVFYATVKFEKEPDHTYCGKVLVKDFKQVDAYTPFYIWAEILEVADTAAFKKECTKISKDWQRANLHTGKGTKNVEIGHEYYVYRSAGPSIFEPTHWEPEKINYTAIAVKTWLKDAVFMLISMVVFNFVLMGLHKWSSPETK